MSRSKDLDLYRAQESEADLQAKIIEWADFRRWRHYHTHDSRRSDEGFPDLVLVRLTRLIFAEIKSEKGVSSPAQLAWLEDLRGATRGWTFEVYLWRPSDWDRIEEILR